MLCKSATHTCQALRRPSLRACSFQTSRHPVAARRSVVAQANPFESFVNGLSVAVKNSPLNEGKKRLAIMQAGNYNEAAVKAKLDAYIADNPVVVFSWTTCPFCVRAKGLLSEVGAKYTAVELNTMEDGPAIRAELAKLTERTSMPNIFIKGVGGVGGCNDGPGVVTLHNQGKLVPMLKAAGAL